MREISREIVKKTTVIEYESNDGKIFSSAEECKKYEESAYGVIYSEFKQTIIKIMSEYEFYNERVGSEEFYIGILEIKNQDDLDKVNRMIVYENNRWHKTCKLAGTEYIGKRIAISLGCDYSEKGYDNIGYIYGSEEEMIEKITEKIRRAYANKEET